MVLTSHGELGNTGLRTGFWIEKFAAPYYVLADAGAEIRLASLKGGQPPIDPKSEFPDAQTAVFLRFDHDKELKEKLAHTLLLNTINEMHYNAVFILANMGRYGTLPMIMLLSR